MTVNKPIILRLTLKTGFPVDGARVQVEAPRIPGFLAIESQDYRNATQYIALDNIATLTALDDELCNINSFVPPYEVKTREY